MDRQTQYFHQKDGKVRFTSFVQFTNKQITPYREFKSLLDFSRTSVTLNVGLAFVHPNDRYVKSIGRTVSKQRSKSNVFYVSGTYYNHCEDFALVYLQGLDTEIPIKLVYQMFYNSDKLHLIEVIL